MSHRREILRAHYLGILRRVATWVSLISILGMSVVALPAHADQETSRTATLSDSNQGDSSVSYQMAFTNTTTTGALAVKSVRFEFCNQATGPIYNTACTLPTGMVRGTTIATQTDNGGAFTNSYAAATSGSSDVLLTNATGNTFTATHAYVFQLTGFTNPTTVGEYYVRVIMCNDTTCTVGAGSNLSWGGFAVDTTNTFSVTANVQEDITFCVAQTIATACSSIGGSSLTLSPNPLSTGAVSDGTAKMAVATNGGHGYAITYNATGFQDTTGDTITAAPTTGAVEAPASEQFGMTLRGQTSGGLNTLGADPSGGTSALVSSNYNSLNSTIAYNTAGAIQVAGQTVAGPTAFTTYTMLYAANIDNLAKPGVYTATQTYIATATF